MVQYRLNAQLLLCKTILP